MSYRLRECPLCGGREFVSRLRARDYHYGNSGEYTQSECRQCTLAFLDPMLEQAELAAFYPRDYYAFADRIEAAKPNHTLKAKIWKLVGPRDHVTRDPEFEKPGTMLDIGCGAGGFIIQMRDKGWDVKGVEPNVAAADYGRNKKGLDIFPGLVMDARFPDESFDYVRMNHSFEHMEHPNQTLDEVYRILAPNGKLMIGVPNRDSFNARLFGRFWFHLALPLHAFSYSVQTAQRMLQKHDFKVERVVFNTEQTPLLVGMQLCFNRNDVSPGFQGRLSTSALATFVCYWAARLQNVLHVADVIEITATKRLKRST
jgi:SAM-dependent methyltransferase